jgi:hypothetical protein
LRSAVAIVCLLFAACSPPPPPPFTIPVRCDDEPTRVCRDDDGCAGIRCVDNCCAQHCLSDADCQPGYICAVDRTQTCVLPPCNPLDPSTCAGGVCYFDRGEARCAIEAPAPDACIVTTSGAITTSGVPVRVEALAVDEEGAPTPWAPAVEWSAERGTFDGDTYRTSCRAREPCRFTVTARIGEATCEGDVVVLPPLADGHTRVVVVDARTHAPLPGVAVHLSMDGSFVVRETDALGLIEVAGRADIVSAFADAHEWHTLLAPGDDVVIATRARAVNEVSGVKGTINIDAMRPTLDFTSGWTGIALPSLVDVRHEDVFGVPRTVDVDLEGDLDDVQVIWPSTFTMSLGENPIQGDWIALGEIPLAWNLTTSLRFDAFASVEFADLVRAVLPSSTGAHHAIAHVTPVSGQRPLDGASFSNWPFEERVMTPSVPAYEERVVLTDARAAPDVLKVALVRTPGRGFVPLGVALDATLRFAPPHDGLEGREILIAAVELDLAAVDLAAAVTPPVRAVFAPDTATDTLTMREFLPHLEGTFDGVAFTSTNDPGADLYRVRFDGWTISSASPPSFAIDELHAGDIVFHPNAPRVDAIAGDSLSPTAFSSK